MMQNLSHRLQAAVDSIFIDHPSINEIKVEGIRKLDNDFQYIGESNANHNEIPEKSMNKHLSQSLFRHPDLVVAPCSFGHGVFAAKYIPADTTLEECYHLRIRKEDCSGIIDDYVYGIAEDDDSQDASKYYSLPLGCGSIFNHSDEHNTEYWHDTERDLIVFYTIKDVSAGEQLFINYGKDWWETRDLTPDNDK